VKTLNLKALFEFTGCVVEKILVEAVGVQVSMRRNRRTKPHCSCSQIMLKDVREGEIAVYDRPLADRATVWVKLPVVQARCPKCRDLCTPRPPDVHPARNVS
jgi:hypothetical protein